MIISATILLILMSQGEVFSHKMVHIFSPAAPGRSVTKDAVAIVVDLGPVGPVGLLNLRAPH